MFSHARHCRSIGELILATHSIAFTQRPYCDYGRAILPLIIFSRRSLTSRLDYRDYRPQRDYRRYQRLLPAAIEFQLLGRNRPFYFDIHTISQYGLQPPFAYCLYVCVLTIIASAGLHSHRISAISYLHVTVEFILPA